jgi:hypothetical protein
MSSVAVFSVQPTSPRPRPIFFIKTKRPPVTRHLLHIGFLHPLVVSSPLRSSVPADSSKRTIWRLKSSPLDRISEVGAALSHSHPHRHLTPMVAGPRVVSIPSISPSIQAYRWLDRGGGNQIWMMITSLRLHYHSTRGAFCVRYIFTVCIYLNLCPDLYGFSAGGARSATCLLVQLPFARG